jgi:hypothetical protein
LKRKLNDSNSEILVVLLAFKWSLKIQFRFDVVISKKQKKNIFKIFKKVKKLKKNNFGTFCHVFTLNEFFSQKNISRDEKLLFYFTQITIIISRSEKRIFYSLFGRKKLLIITAH